MITDIRMPGIDGLELIRRSRELYQEHPVHFVVISGFDCFSYAQTAIKYGVSDYILKPINQKELQGVLRKIVEEQRMVQEEQEARTQLLEDMNDAKRKLKEEFLRKLVLPPGRREGHLAPEKTEGFSVLLDGEFRVLHVLLDVQEEGVVAVYRENCMKCVCEKIRQAAEPLCSSVEQARGELFLLHYPAQEWMRIEAALQDTLHQVRNELMKMKLCQVTVGAGCAVTEEEEIWKSAVSARGALEERLLLGCNKLIIRNEFREEKRCLLDQVQIRQLERAAEVFDYEQLERCVDAAYEGVRREYPRDASVLYRVAEEITRVYLRSVQGIYEAEGYQTELTADYLFCNTLQELQAEVKKGLKRDVGGIREKHRICESAVVKKAKDYIYKNYMHLLSLEELAEQVSLNPVYFGTLFKKETGDTVINFLIEYRMEQAKQLLKNINYHVSEIARLVGYDDERHFSKQFKKRVGITPKEYRKIHL